MSTGLLSVGDYTIITQINNDDWNNYQNGECCVEYYDKKTLRKIAEIKYKLYVGQIEYIYVDAEYRNKGFGKEILSGAIADIKLMGCKTAWTVTTKGHSFWSNVYNKKFTYKKHLHSSVTDGGYVMFL